jgi:hypothetical protein
VDRLRRSTKLGHLYAEIVQAAYGWTTQERERFLRGNKPPLDRRLDRSKTALPPLLLDAIDTWRKQATVLVERRHDVAHALAYGNTGLGTHAEKWEFWRPHKKQDNGDAYALTVADLQHLDDEIRDHLINGLSIANAARAPDRWQRILRDGGIVSVVPT